MERVAHRALNRQPKGQPCALCGRRSETGKSVPLVGWVGPTCYHRVAALRETLEKLDLKRFLDGPVPFEPDPSTDAHGISCWAFPDHIEALRRRAEKLGFSLEWHWVSVGESATCWLRLPQNAERRRKLWGRLERAQTVVSA